MELKIEVNNGKLRLFDADYEALRIAVKSTIEFVTRQATLDIRQQVLNAGMGQRMANTVRNREYPKNKPSTRAAGVIWSNTSYFDVFAEGATIHGKNGQYLAIPTSAAPERGINRKRITPDTFPEWQYGPLRYVYRKGKPALLVVDNLRAHTGKRIGKFARGSKGALKTGTGLATVVMFVLVPAATIKKVVDYEGVVNRRGNQLAEYLALEWEREIEKIRTKQNAH